MKQRAQINIVHDGKQLRYMVELNDTFTQTQTTNGFYHYMQKADYVQFFRNTRVINNFSNAEVFNVQRFTNTWAIDETYHANYYIPKSVDQRQLVVFFPRYSIESFFTNTFSNDNELSLSGIRYIMTAYIYIAGVKVILGSYMFDPRSALATNKKVRYKNMDYDMSVTLSILDPVAITYDDKWKPFRVNVCGELPYTNNTGSVLHIELEPVSKVGNLNIPASPDCDMYHYLDGNYRDVYVYRELDEKTDKYTYYKRYYTNDGIYKEEDTNELEFEKAFKYTIALNGEYHKIDDFNCGATSIPFEIKPADYLHGKLEFDGDAKISLLFNDVYDGDIDLYLGETYGLWRVNDDGEYLDKWGNVIPRNHNTGMVDAKKLVPRESRIVIELVIKDKENIYEVYNALIKNSTSYTFNRMDLSHDWDWYTDGLILVGGIEVYDTNLNDIEEIRETCFPIINIMTNQIPLTKDNFRFLVPTDVVGIEKRRIKIDYVNMNEYNVSVVNKIQKNIIQVNRPDDYKSNIIRPVFYRSEESSDITIHPEVLENIGLNLNKYKTKVDVFYIRIEGVDFIETGRTSKDIIFAVDGNQLPGAIPEGLYYILNENFELITSGKYKYVK